MRVRLYHPAVVLLPAVLAGPPLVAATPAAGARASAASPDREAELERIRGQIAALESRLVELSERRDGLAGDLERTSLELELQGERLAEVRAERAIAEASLVAAEDRLAAARAALDEARDALRRGLGELYRIGRHGALRLLLSIRSEDRLLDGLRILRYLARRDARAIAGHRARRAELAVERAALTRHERRLGELLAREAARHAELGATERSQRRRLGELEGVRTRLSAETASLLDKERKLAHLLDFLYGRASGKLDGVPLEEFRGALDWPLAGRVVTPFGPRLDPRYRTRVPHNGLEIEPLAGADARAVFPGRVVFAAPLEGYGLTAVVHHPTRAFTIYAGLGSLRVAVGDMVSLGEVLGAAGARLYFELRVDNRPQNPLDWLR